MENISIAKEIADGLRVIFDFNLRNILLYGNHGEVQQYKELIKPGRKIPRNPPLGNQKAEILFSNQSGKISNRRQSNATSVDLVPSCHSSTTSSQSTTSRGSLNPPGVNPTSPQAIKVLRELHKWKLVPDNIYEETSKKPMESLIYGPIHLLRLFVKLPEIVGKMSLPVKTKKSLVKFMESVVDYFQNHQDLFDNDDMV